MHLKQYYKIPWVRRAFYMSIFHTYHLIFKFNWYPVFWLAKSGDFNTLPTQIIFLMQMTPCLNSGFQELSCLPVHGQGKKKCLGSSLFKHPSLKGCLQGQILQLMKVPRPTRRGRQLRKVDVSWGPLLGLWREASCSLTHLIPWLPCEMEIFHSSPL